MTRRRMLLNMILFQLEHSPIHTVAIIGRMRRGKTNLMRYLSRGLAERGYKCFYVNAPEPEELVDVIEGLRGEGDRLAIFVDDISFLASGKSEEILRLESSLARIRHITGTGDRGRLLLALAFHYHRAINPFLRLTDTTILMDLTSKEEVEIYSERFSKRMLWAFYRVYDAYVWRDPRLVKWMQRRGLSPDGWRPVLAKVVNREAITFVPYVPPEEARWHPVDGHRAQGTAEGPKPPPITWSEFQEKVRKEFGIRARNEKLWRLYKWLFEDLMGYMIPTRNPHKLLAEEEDGSKAAQGAALATA